MKKKFLAAVLAAAMVLSLLPASALAVSIMGDGQSATAETPAGEESAVQSVDAPAAAAESGGTSAAASDGSEGSDAKASLMANEVNITANESISDDNTTWEGGTIDGTGSGFTAENPLTVTIDEGKTLTISATLAVSGYVKFTGGGTLKHGLAATATTGVISVADGANITFDTVTVDGDAQDNATMIIMPRSATAKTTVTLKNTILQNTYHEGNPHSSLWMKSSDGTNCEYIFDGVTLDNTDVSLGKKGAATVKGTITTKNTVKIAGGIADDNTIPAITRDSGFTDGDLFQVGTSDTSSALTLENITVQGDGKTEMGRVISVAKGSVALTGATIQNFVYNGTKPSGAANDIYFIALDEQYGTRSLTMDSDSVIQKNTIKSSSLFAVGGGHTATLSGKITDNKLEAEEGQLIMVGAVSGSRLTLDGARITGNTLASESYAVRARVSGGTTNYLRVKGATQIKDNTYTDADTNTATQQNVYVATDATMAVDGGLTDGAAIGVTTQTAPTGTNTVTVAVGGTDSEGEAYTVTESDAAKFIPDNDAYAAIYDATTAGSEKVVLSTWGDYYVHSPKPADATDEDDTVYGDDATGTGTAAKPFATIQKALEEIDGRGTIHVMDDLTLTSAVTVSKNVTILSDDDNDATENDSFSITRDSSLGGSMFSVSEGGALTLKNLTVDGGSTQIAAVQGGGVSVAGGGALTATGCTFQNHNMGTASEGTYGAAIGNQGTTELTSCKFTMNTVSSSGSALYNAAGTMTVTDCEITENTCTSSQGAIFVKGGTVNITDTTISGNEAAWTGPAMYITGGTVNLGNGVVITKNQVTTNNRDTKIAGAVDLESGGTLNLSGNVQITGNTYGKNSGREGENANLYVGNDANATLTGALAGDAAIGVTTATKPTGTDTVTVAVGGTDSGGDAYTVTESDAAKFIPDDDAYAAVYDATDSDNPKVILGTLGDYYVSAATATPAGDDSNAGTKDAPFATIGKAYEQLGAFGTIHVMSDLTLSTGLTFNGSKKITVISDTNGDLTDSEEVYTVTRDTTLTGSAMLKVSAGDVTLRNIIFDGNKEKVESMYALRVEGSESARGTLTLGAGAVVQNNKAGAGSVGENNDGAGVSIGAYGTLNIQDGARIQNNETKGRGGGVSPRQDSSVVNMTGGVITGNKRNADSYHGGGGVNIAGGQFIMSGGSITGNSDPFSSGKGGGVYFAGGALTVSGTAYIGGNTAGADGSYASNVYLTDGQTVAIGADHLSGGASIGVYTATDPSESADVEFATNANEADRAYFYSDKAATTGVLYCSGTADTPAAGAHEHVAGTLWLSVAARSAAVVKANGVETAFSGDAASVDETEHRYTSVDDALAAALAFAAEDGAVSTVTVVTLPTSDVTGTLAAGDALTVNGATYTAATDAEITLHSDGSVELTSGSVSVGYNKKIVIADPNGEDGGTMTIFTVRNDGMTVTVDENGVATAHLTSSGQGVDIAGGSLAGVKILSNNAGDVYFTDPLLNDCTVFLPANDYSLAVNDNATVTAVTGDGTGNNGVKIVPETAGDGATVTVPAGMTVTITGKDADGNEKEYELVGGKDYYVAADGQVHALDGEAVILLNEGGLGSVTQLGSGMVSYQIPGAMVLGSAPETFEVSVDSGYFKVGSDKVGTGVTFASALTASGKVVTGATGALDTAATYTYVSFTVDNTATLADLQSWLRGVTFYKETAAAQNVSARGENVELGDVVAFQGHYYAFVAASGGISWSDAYKYAKTAEKFNGLTGYLLTVTDQQEHDYIYQKFGKNGWMGATRAIATDGYDKTTYAYSTGSYGWDWYWVCGPEAGTKIGTQNTSGGGMSSVASYANWKSGEPNGKSVPGAGYEGFGQYGYGSNGLWNDLPDKKGSGNIQGYYVEYGGYDNETADTAAAADTRAVGDLSEAAMNVSVAAATGSGVTLTVSPVNTETCDYVVLDGAGKVVELDDGAIYAVSDDTIAISGLTAGETYQVVAVAKGATVEAGEELAAGVIVQESAPVTLASGTDVSGAKQTNNDDGTISIKLTDATDANKDYALIDQTTGEVIGWITGADGGVTFENLDPSHAYAAVEADHAADGTPLVTNAASVLYPAPLLDELSAEVADDGTVTVTVENPVAGAAYYAVDADCNAIPATVAADGTVTISGLTPGDAYTIVAVKAGTEPAEDASGTKITTPAAPVSADQISRSAETDETTSAATGTDEVTVSGTKTTLQYALVDQNGNYIDQDGKLSETPVWVKPVNDGDELTWNGLDPDGSYTVLTIPVGADDIAIPAESEAIGPLLDGETVTTGYDAQQGVTVTVSPADPDKVYALLDREGNVVAEWTAPASAENGDGTYGEPTVVFAGLDVGTAYEVVSADSAAATPAQGTGAEITTVDSAAIPAAGGAAKVEGVTVTAPAQGGTNTGDVTVAAAATDGAGGKTPATITVANSGDSFTVGGVDFTAAEDGQVFTVDETGVVTAELGGGESVTVNDVTYTAGDGGATLTVDKDGSVTLTDGSVVLTEDGQSVTVGGTEITKPDGTGDVTVSAKETGAATVTLTAGASADIGADPDAETYTAGDDGATLTVDKDGNVTLTDGSVVLTEDGQSVTVGGTEITKPDGTGSVTVSAEDDGAATVTLTAGASADIGADPDAETYTAGDDGATLTVDKDGNVTLTDGSVVLTEDGQSVTVGGTEITKPAGTGTVTVSAENDGAATVTLTAGASADIGADPDAETYTAGDGGATLTVDKDGNVTLADGSVVLTEDGQSVTVGDTEITKPDGTGSVTVSAEDNGAATVTLDPNAGITIGADPDAETYTAGADGATLTVDKDGNVTLADGSVVLTEDGQSVTVGGTEITKPDGTGTVTVSAEDDGAATVTLTAGASADIGADPDAETYTAGDGGAILTVDKDGNVTLTDGSVVLTEDGQSVTVGDTEIVKSGADGTVLVSGDGMVTISEGASAIIGGKEYSGPAAVQIGAGGENTVYPNHVTGVTAHTITLQGVAGTKYTVRDAAGNVVTDAVVSVDAATGKVTVSGLDKGTGYTVSSVYGDVSATTSSLDAADIARAFDKTVTEDSNRDDAISGAESDVVEVILNEAGGYTVTLKRDITAEETGAAAGQATVTIPDDWGSVTLDLAGYDILGADATEAAPAAAAIAFVTSDPAGSGTDLTVTSSAPDGKVVGGSGYTDGYADGADGIVSAAADTALTLRGENVTVLGGDGASAETEGGDGGSGVSGSLSVAIVDGSTVIGGNGGSATASGGTGGNGGDGVSAQGSVTVTDGTLIGGNAGTGGSAGLGLNGDGDITGNSAVTNGEGGNTATISAGATRVTVSNGVPGATYTLYDTEGNVVDTAEADDSGSVTFSDLTSETAYVVKVTENGAQSVLATVTTTAASSGASHRTSTSDKSSAGVSGTGKTTGGSVSISPANPAAGETVTITLTPDSGYVLGSLAVLDQNGNALTLTANGDGTYSFTMPASGGATVNAVFRALETGYADCGWDENCPAYGFADLDLALWYHDGIHFCVENGYMVGVGDGLFAPDGVLTRAELVTILWRVSGSPAVAGGTFSDVAEGAWYTQAVIWGAAAGVVKGYETGDFGPADPITREQLALMLYRYAGSPAGEDATGLTGYNDAAAISDWAGEAMRWAVTRAGIITGKDNGSLDPQGNATRAEAAAMLMRYLMENK